MAKPSRREAQRAAHLIIQASSTPMAWCTCDRHGDIEAVGHCAVDELASLPPADSVRVLVDAGQVTPMRLDLPVMSKHRLAQALVWAAEEHVAGPVEDEHVVAAGRTAAGELMAVAVARARMDAWQSLFQVLNVDALIPDALCLPWQPGTVSLARSGETILMRWDEWAFASFSAEVASLMVDQWPSSSLVWWGGDEPPDEWRDRVNRQAPQAPNAGMLAELKDRALNPPINLLTGPWRPHRVRGGQRQWHRVARWAAAVGALALVSLAVEQQVLSHQAATARDDVKAQFAALFPDQPAIGRERELLERELAQLQFGQAAGLLTLMVRVQPIIQANQPLVVDALNYSEGQLELSLTADDVASLDRVVQQLNDLSLQASVSSATLSSAGAQGRVRVAMGES